MTRISNENAKRERWAVSYFSDLDADIPELNLFV